MQKIRLTQTVQKGGCAAKIEASELRKILSQVKFPPAGPELLIDGHHFDDAAIYKVNETTALVQTVDFFTPIVDDPYSFGKIAAANSLSDVYAMGGSPVTAMAVLAFPLATLDSSVVVQVLQGASDILAVAGTSLAGGHSIDDETLKFGLSVTGLVNPSCVWSNQGAREGDTLILTKALGTGCSTAALKREAVTEDQIREAIDSMATLNNLPQLLDAETLKSIHAATDITGFGLSGHSWQMAKASQKNFSIEFSKLPYFANAPELLRDGFLTKAHRTNRSYTDGKFRTSNLEAWQELLCHDPQTSGGLLLSVDATNAASLLAKIQKYFPRAQIIGRVSSGEGIVTVS